MNVKEMIQRTEELGLHRLQKNPLIQFEDVKIIPMKGMNSLICAGRSIGESDTYKTVIAFYGVDFGKNKIIDDLTKIRVSCSCRDFYFTFARWDYYNNSLYGRNRKIYVRKTTTYPERNPDHIPGMCKHLINFLDVLANQNLIERK
jgi:hypothetical protein